MINICLCGSDKFDAYEQPSYRTTDTGESVSSDRKFGCCVACGLIRQLDLPFNNEEEYRKFYESYPPTSTEYKVKDWDHDLQLARQRCDAYGIANDGSLRKMLDVGSGSGAFVYECRQRQQEAYGCELSTYFYEKSDDWIYRRAFEDIGFPTDHFQWVTVHDVLEHSLSPLKMIDEMFRITDQDGTCIVDIPNFFNEAGKHHWKDAEHIWMFAGDQLQGLLQKVGFVVDKVEVPVESKLVFYCHKPTQQRKTILIPPGIGDSYWSIVKIESFIESEKIGIPEVIPITNSGATKYNSHKRSIPFLQMFPFLHCDKAITVIDSKCKQIWNEAYNHQSRTIWRNVMGYDYFLCWNGYLKVGTPLDNVDTHIKCNWHPKMWISLEEDKYRQEALKQWGKYVVCYFPSYGTYKHWTAEFPVSSVVESIRKLAEGGYTPLIVGAAWDHDNEDTQRLIVGSGAVDLTGKTSLAQLFGLLKGATAVVGYPSGLTVMAGVFGTKTLIIWNPYYNPDFAWNTLPPDVRKITYFADDSFRLTPDRLFSEVKDLIEIGTVDSDKYPKLRTADVSTPPIRIMAKKVVEIKRKSLPTRPPPSLRNVATSTSVIRQFRPAVHAVDSNPVTIMCVFKSGGKDFTADYVVKLRNMITRYTTIPYRFVCLSDISLDSNICETIQLKSGLTGWWNKLELFIPRPEIDSEYIVYFDLDTLIIRNIDTVLQVNTEFAALGGWFPGPNRSSKENFGSGMMIWKNNGQYAFLHDEFTNGSYKHGDQGYIVDSLIAHEKPYDTLQNITLGIYSYKRNCLRELPQDARIVCFHGYPRPHQALINNWVKSYWR